MHAQLRADAVRKQTAVSRALRLLTRCAMMIPS